MRSSSTKTAAVLVLAVIIILALGAPALAAPPWPDAPNTWWQTNYGVTDVQVGTVAEGLDNGNFGPALPVTRAQFAKMAVSGLGVLQANPTTATFLDVAKGTTFFTYVEGAYASGLVEGYPTSSGKLFKPGNDIPRQQTNAILGRYLSQAEINASGVIHGAGSLTYPTLDQWYAAEGAFYLNGFFDSNKLAADYKATTAYLVYRGVVVGADGYLKPDQTLNRAQAAVLVLRAAAVAAAITTPPVAPSGLTMVPASPSNGTTPQVDGHSIPGGLIHVYDTFGGTTTQVAEVTVNAAGNFYADIVTPLLPGTHSFTAKAKNSAGLVSATSAAVAYVLDTTSPTGSITAPVVPNGQPDKAVNTNQPVFTVDAADAGSGVKQVEFQYTAFSSAPGWTPSWHSISVDTGAPYVAAWGATTLADGQYEFQAIITDNAGNVTTLGPVPVTVDTTPPTVTITSLVAQGSDHIFYTEDSEPVFTADATDPLPNGVTNILSSGVVKVDFMYVAWSEVLPTAWSGFSLISSDSSPAFGANYSTGMPDGHYVFAARATDRAGNVSVLMGTPPSYASGVTQEVVIDSAAPLAATNVVGSATPAGGTITGANFHATWTPSVSAYVTSQSVYLLPTAQDLKLTGSTPDLPIATFGDNTTADWTGAAGTTTDSRGAPLAPGSYRVWIVATDPFGRTATANSIPFTLQVT